MRRDFERELQRAAADWFASSSRPVSRRQPYILSNPHDWQHNLIDPAVYAFLLGEKESARLAGRAFPVPHKYAHHGLSSQAMLFNLVGPLVVRSDLAPLRSAFRSCGVTWPEGPVEAQFEFTDRSVFGEDQGQPTSLDLAIHAGPERHLILVECKLTERGFGGCSVFTEGDCDGTNPVTNHTLCHLHGLGRKYLTHFQKHGLVSGEIAAQHFCPLANHYQFFRELLTAIELNGTFVLLYDERSHVYAGPNGRGQIPYLMRLLPREAANRVRLVSVQQVVDAVRASGDHPWIEQFCRKYALPSD